MTEQTKVALSFSLIVGLVVALVLILCWQYEEEPTIIYIQDPNYVQPPCEAQRRLKEQGLYHGRIDNIWGKETDKAFCDYMAINSVEQALKEAKKE